MSETGTDDDARLQRLTQQLEQGAARLREVRPFAKFTRRAELLNVARRLLTHPQGTMPLYAHARALEEAGIFADSDWATPEILQADLSVHTLRAGPTDDVVLECLSDLRLLAVATGRYAHPTISAEHAQHHLSQVLALNLDLLFGAPSEADRSRDRDMSVAVHHLLQHLVQEIGYDNIIDRLIDEVWRILAQRPVRVDNIKGMITQIAACLYNPAVAVTSSRGADRVISALFGPTQACVEDPGLEAYQERLIAMDAQAWQQEASGFARAMHDTGLVSAYHTVFLRFILDASPDLMGQALGLSSTGREALLCYQDLCHTLIRAAVHPETPQAVYGLAMMLERGILYDPPLAPSLWRQLALPLSETAAHALSASTDPAQAPHVHLLAATLCVLGQPLGVGQGNNPTCQSARAISMWAYSDPEYLLQMVAWSARDEEIIMHFEGQSLSSRAVDTGMAAMPPMDVDPLSVVLVPHLDRIYMAMGQLCAHRGDDPHRWVNPEFHGWWVGRGFSIAVDVATGKLRDYPDFVRRFYSHYHPAYNGNQPLIHPQPAGLAITDSAARFVGWHAITLLRVTLDQEGETRAYFFNPNNDSGQNFGNGVIVSTEGRGERFGESSLPIAEFTSRLYIFHYDPLERGHPELVSEDILEHVEGLAGGSWAAAR